MAVGRNVDVSIGSPVCAVTVGAKEGATLGLAMVGGEGAFDAFPRFCRITFFGTFGIFLVNFTPGAFVTSLLSGSGTADANAADANEGDFDLLTTATGDFVAEDDGFLVLTVVLLDDEGECVFADVASSSSGTGEGALDLSTVGCFVIVVVFCVVIISTGAFE